MKNIFHNLIANFLWFLIIFFSTFIFELAKSFSLTQTISNIYYYISYSFLIPAWVVIIFAFIYITTLRYLISTIRKLKVVNNQTSNEYEYEKTKIHISPSSFFHDRICFAFPGIIENDLNIFTLQKDIQNRLKVLLSQPLKFDEAIGQESTKQPIWWFRGFSSSPIETFEILSKKKVLINYDELIIKRMAIYRGIKESEDFVYIECNPDKQTGLVNYKTESIDEESKRNEEFKEYFAIHKNKIISRQEFCDGAKVIKGKPEIIKNAEMRSRNLTKYNYIISAQTSVYNCTKFEEESQSIFPKLLSEEIDFEDFMTFMKRFH